MKRKTFTLFCLIFAMLFAAGCTSKSSASADEAVFQETEETSIAMEEGAVDLDGLTPEQLVAEGMDYFYATNGKLYDKEKATEYFQKAADQGYGLAFYYLGEVVQRSAEQDRFEKALGYYEKAVELGCDRGLLGKGDLLEYGRGMEHDSEQARQLYEEALSRSCVLANLDLGDYYRDGVGVDRDYIKALDYYTAFLNDKSTADLDEDVYARIGDLYFTGIAGIDRDYQEALSWYTKGQEAGKASSIARLGDMYYQGYGVIRDYGKALTYYTEAMDMGDGYATCRCGLWYVDVNIDNTERDPEMAEKCLVMAAAMGHPNAYYKLGRLYLTNYYGFKTDEDPQIADALGWFQLGIEEGNTSCMRAMGDFLGLIYIEETEDNIDNAIEYYEMARLAGDLDSYYALGRFYANRISDGKQASEWFTKGAELGNSLCMQNLGSIYFNGFKGDVPVGQSMSKGKEWYMKAAEAGNASAMVSLGNIHYFGYMGLLDVHKGQELFSEAAARGDGSAMWCIGHRYHGQSLLEPLDMREEVDRACYWYAKAMEVFGEANNDWIKEYIDGLVLYTSLSQETADQIMQDVHKNFRIG